MRWKANHVLDATQCGILLAIRVAQLVEVTRLTAELHSVVQAAMEAAVVSGAHVSSMRNLSKG